MAYKIIPVDYDPRMGNWSDQLELCVHLDEKLTLTLRDDMLYHAWVNEDDLHMWLSDISERLGGTYEPMGPETYKIQVDGDTIDVYRPEQPGNWMELSGPNLTQAYSRLG